MIASIRQAPPGSSESDRALARVLRDLHAAARIARLQGPAALFIHARTIALVRLHRFFFDRRARRGMPWSAGTETVLDGLSIAGREWERAAAVAHSPVPCKVLDWALAGLKINPAEFHFLDIGSGVGQGLLQAAQLPFRGATGVELATELHRRAQENLNWINGKELLRAPVRLLNASALDADLPEDPVVILLFNPFNGTVMSGFLHRLVTSARMRPRKILILYINPVAASAFQTSDFRRLKLRGREQRRINAFSPFKVHAYECRPRSPARTSRTEPQGSATAQRGERQRHLG